MHCSSPTQRALRTAVAGLVALAVAPAAWAQNGAPPATDPAAAALALANAALAGMPTADPAAMVAQALAAAPETPAPDPATAPAPEAVPAAAAQPNPAMEPHPSPPPPQPAVPEPDGTAPIEELVPISPVEAAAPTVTAAPEQAPEPQYQPEPAQYQPAAAVVTAPEPPAEPPPPPEEEWSWDWTWSCGGSKPPTQPPTLPGDGMPKNWNWNWDWNCGTDEPAQQNKKQESGAQYQPVITRYQPLNVNVSIRIGSPGDDGAVAQTNVVLAVAAGPASATVEAAAAAPVPAAEASTSETPSATPPDADSATKRPALKKQKTKLASPEAGPQTLVAARPASTGAPSWAYRPVVSDRAQPAKPEAHRSRSQHRQPTRRPHPPRRAPSIPVGFSGASPPLGGAGGSDGGGFGFALLLVPFVLALVDSVRRSVRDITPPVARAFSTRRERPG